MACGSVVYRAPRSPPEPVPPRGLRPRHRQGARVVDPQRHRPRQHPRRRIAQARQIPTGSASGTAPVAAAKTRSPSSGVWAGTIARARPSCAVTARRRASALVRRASVATTAMVVLAPASASSARRRRRAGWSARAQAPELGALLERPGPEMRPVPDRDPPERVHRHERRDAGPRALDRGRGAAQAPLEVRGARAEPGPDRAHRHRTGAGASGRREAEVAIGRIPAPRFVPAVEEIEQDRRRHDRHPGRARPKSRGRSRRARR